MINKDVIVKSSKIEGKGVFALRNFKKGEIVFKWHPKKTMSKKEIPNLSKNEQEYVCCTDRKCILEGIPERFVNHSCEPNAYINNLRYIALRDIKKGEEITEDYSKNTNGKIEFKCRCGSESCKNPSNS